MNGLFIAAIVLGGITLLLLITAIVLDEESLVPLFAVFLLAAVVFAISGAVSQQSTNKTNKLNYYSQKYDLNVVAYDKDSFSVVCVTNRLTTKLDLPYVNSDNGKVPLLLVNSVYEPATPDLLTKTFPGFDCSND